jgi:hypothetical protein
MPPATGLHEALLDVRRGLAYPHVRIHERTAMDSELGRVVDALPDLIFGALPDGQIDFFNKRWCEYTVLV